MVVRGVSTALGLIVPTHQSQRKDKSSCPVIPDKFSRLILIDLMWIFFPFMKVRDGSALFNPQGLKVGEKSFHKWKLGVLCPEEGGGIPAISMRMHLRLH